MRTADQRRGPAEYRVPFSTFRYAVMMDRYAACRDGLTCNRHECQHPRRALSGPQSLTRVALITVRSDAGTGRASRRVAGLAAKTGLTHHATAIEDEARLASRDTEAPSALHVGDKADDLAAIGGRRRANRGAPGRIELVGILANKAIDIGAILRLGPAGYHEQQC